jgi:hypothetical protein
MPSATTTLPSEAPSSTMARTTAASLAPPCRRLTKLRSIFRLSMGSVDRWLSAGVAGAEVVDGQRHAQVAQLFQHRPGGFQARHQDVLGQLQAQVAGCRPLSIRARVTRATKLGCAMSCAETLTLMLSGRIGHVPLLPLAQLAAGAVQHEVGQPRHQPGFFGNRQEGRPV